MAKTPKPWLRKGRGWYVTIDGQQHSLGKKKKEAFAEYHRLMIQPPETRQVSGKSLLAVVDDYLEYVANNRAEKTFVFYRDLLQKFCACKEHSTLRADQVKPFHVQSWVDGFPHLSKNSRRNHMRAVKRCLKWATKFGYLDSNPVEHLELPAGERKEVLVTQAEYELILSLASPDTLKGLITVTWETGCRPQESLRVEARHVDLENQRWLFPTSEAKGERVPRVVYLTDEAMHITRRLMLKNPQGKLFRSSSGKPWTVDTVNSAFGRIKFRMAKSIMRERGLEISEKEVEEFIPQLSPTKMVKGVLTDKTRAELRSEARKKLTARLATQIAPGCCLYDLRHSWATHALERGVDSVTVAVLMGHSDPSMLAKHYQHLAHNAKYLLTQTKKASARA